MTVITTIICDCCQNPITKEKPGIMFQFEPEKQKHVHYYCLERNINFRLSRANNVDANILARVLLTGST